VESWWIERRLNCRAALNAGQSRIAYEIAVKHGLISGEASTVLATPGSSLYSSRSYWLAELMVAPGRPDERLSRGMVAFLHQGASQSGGLSILS
jgi:hypothetical protein